MDVDALGSGHGVKGLYGLCAQVIWIRHLESREDLDTTWQID